MTLEEAKRELGAAEEALADARASHETEVERYRAARAASEAEPADVDLRVAAIRAERDYDAAFRAMQGAEGNVAAARLALEAAV